MDFEKTGYARKLFEADIPRIVKALEGINKNLERLANMQENNYLEDNEVTGMIQDFFTNKKNRNTKGEDPLDMD